MIKGLAEAGKQSMEALVGDLAQDAGELINGVPLNAARCPVRGELGNKINGQRQEA